jgi:oligopeptide transport system permease protein
MMSIFILLAIVVIIIVAPMICPYSYDTIIRVNGQRDRGIANLGMMEYSEMELQYMEETGEKLFPHIFGTDSLGRDYFIRCIYGTRVSLSVGVVAAVMVLIIGVKEAPADEVTRPGADGNHASVQMLLSHGGGECGKEP